MSGKCEWEENRFRTYKTKCGHYVETSGNGCGACSVYIGFGQENESDFKYCPYCGKTIQEVK